MIRSKKHLLILSFMVTSLLLGGCSNLLLPSRISRKPSQEDAISSREDYTSSSSYFSSSDGRSSSSHYSSSSENKSSSSSSSSRYSSSSYIPSSSINYDDIPTTTEGFVIENGVVTKYTGKETVVKVPDVWDGKPVTTIGSFAFVDCSSVTLVAFPNTITSIQGCIFRYCSSLVSFNIPASLVDLGSDLVGGCHSLTSIDVDENNPYFSSYEGALFNKDKTKLLICPPGKTGNYAIPSGVTEIGQWAFCTCDSLTNIDIPNTVIKIEYGAFYMCTKITSFSIPSSVTTFEECAFSHCYGLKSITIPSSVTSIGSQAFLNCLELSTINVENTNKYYFAEDNVLFTKDKSVLLCCVMSKEGSYTIPEGVVEIIQNAFYGCRLITEINMPSTLTTIGPWSFSLCSSIIAFNVSSNNKSFCSKDGVVFNKAMTKLVICPAARPGSYTVPNGVTEIGDMAFEYCSSLTTIILPDGLTKIGQYSFNGCQSLSWIVLPSSLDTIRHDAFSSSNVIKMFYKGTESQWSSITFEDNIDDSQKTQVYYYSETKPTGSGNYWHYVDDVPTVW